METSPQTPDAVASVVSVNAPPCPVSSDISPGDCCAQLVADLAELRDLNNEPPNARLGKIIKFGKDYLITHFFDNVVYFHTRKRSWHTGQWIPAYTPCRLPGEPYDPKTKLLAPRCWRLLLPCDAYAVIKAAKDKKGKRFPATIAETARATGLPSDLFYGMENIISERTLLLILSGTCVECMARIAPNLWEECGFIQEAAAADEWRRKQLEWEREKHPGRYQSKVAPRASSQG